MIGSDKIDSNVINPNIEAKYLFFIAQDFYNPPKN